MTHLGERITPLVDGQLAADVAERASIHLANCGDCREAVADERLMKSRLATLGSPEPGDELVRRLLELAGPEGPLPPRVGHVPGTPRPRPVSGPGRPPRAATGPVSARAGRATSSARPGGTRPAGRLSRVARVRLTAAMVGAACLVGAGVAGGVVTAGGGRGPTVVPPMDTLVVEHSASTGTLPFGDPNAWDATETVEAGR